MSKTQLKLASAVETVVSAVHHSGVMSAALDVGTFRTMFKLTSLGKKAVARAIDDVLTTNGIVEQFGAWVLAEIEHPMYQLSQLTGNRVNLFKDKKTEAGDEYVETSVTAGFGLKAVEEEEEDDEANERALDQEDAERKAEAEDKTREEEGLVAVAKPGEDLRSLSPEQLVARAKGTKAKAEKKAKPVKKAAPAKKAKKTSK